jgi:hypothetical protein
LETKQDDDVRKKLLEMWIDDLKICSQYFRTTDYLLAWSRFENNIVDVPGVAPFRQLLETKKKEWGLVGEKWLREWAKEYPYENQFVEFREEKQDEIKQLISEKLCNYMLQLIMEKMFV